MQKSFEYIKVQTAMESIEVEDIGNTSLEAWNDFGLRWYFYSETDTGMTTIKEFGPLCSSLDTSKLSFEYSLERKEYNEKYICKRIANFLNNPKREITQVNNIELGDLESKIRDVKKLL